MHGLCRKNHQLWNWCNGANCLQCRFFPFFSHSLPIFSRFQLHSTPFVYFSTLFTFFILNLPVFSSQTDNIPHEFQQQYRKYIPIANRLHVACKIQTRKQAIKQNEKEKPSNKPQVVRIQFRLKIHWSTQSIVHACTLLVGKKALNLHNDSIGFEGTQKMIGRLNAVSISTTHIKWRLISTIRILSHMYQSAMIIYL